MAIVERDLAVEFAADEGIEVEVRRFCCLEQQLVVEQAVDAFLPREAHGLQRGATGNERDRGRTDPQGAWWHRRLPG